MIASTLPGSKIQIDTHGGFDQIILPYRKKNIFAYLIGLFLLFWLGGWFLGFMTVMTSILNGSVSLFLIFWLGGWSLGGIFVSFMIYKIFRPSLPEKLLLNKPHLAYDTGKPSLKMAISPSEQIEFFKSLFRRRKFFDLEPDAIRTLQLRGGNRLTLDVGIERLEIGKELTEIEREWLYEVLAKEYL